MPGAFATDASDHDISAVGRRFSSALSRLQQRGCYWISNKRTNDGQAMKTPIEKASAVCSGGPSSVNKRRKVDVVPSSEFRVPS